MKNIRTVLLVVSIPESLLVFSTGQHRYAPEIKRMSIILLDNNQQENVEETFDHHEPDYDDEEAADELAWRLDAFWDEQMDNAINEAVKKTISKNLR